MSAEKNINIINATLKLTTTMILGALRITLFFLKLLPTIWSKALTILIKVGLVFKLLIDPLLRLFGAFFAGLWAALVKGLTVLRDKRRTSSANREGNSHG